MKIPYHKSIKIIRMIRGLKQKELAERVDCGTSHICLVESRKRIPSKELVNKICKELNVNKRVLDALEYDDLHLVENEQELQMVKTVQENQQLTWKW